MKNDDDNDTNEEANNLFVFLCWLSVTLTLLAFAILAVWTSYRLPSATKDVETFITAKKSMTWLRVLWSLYSSSIGCWVLFLPASYVQFGGYLSIISYAISTGIPLYLIAFWGCQMLSRVQKNINSISDFALKRYGPIVQYYVISLTLLNMCIEVCAAVAGVAAPTATAAAAPPASEMADRRLRKRLPPAAAPRPTDAGAALPQPRPGRARRHAAEAAGGARRAPAARSIRDGRPGRRGRAGQAARREQPLQADRGRPQPGRADRRQL